MLEGGFDPFALLHFGMENFVGLLEGGRAFVQRLLQCLVLEDQVFLGAATRSDILGHCREVLDAAVLIEHGSNIASDPQACAVGQPGLALDAERLSSVDGLLEQLAHVIKIIGIDKLVDLHCQQLRGGRANDLAITRIDQLERSCPIDLSQTHVCVAQQGTEILFLETKPDFDALSLRNLPA